MNDIFWSNPNAASKITEMMGELSISLTKEFGKAGLTSATTTNSITPNSQETTLIPTTTQIVSVPPSKKRSIGASDQIASESTVSNILLKDWLKELDVHPPLSSHPQRTDNLKWKFH